MKNGLDVYVYFDNDQHGYAAFNAITLQELIKSLGFNKQVSNIITATANFERS